MSVLEPGSAGSSLIGRIKSILLQPSATWDVIDTEPATIAGLYRGYVLPLAAIPAVCTFVGMLAFGIGGIFGISFRPSPVWLITQAVVSYALSLAMVYVMALIIEGLAPNFDGTKDRVQAFKVAAYASTASWVAGVFSLIPMLAIIGLLGALYSLYLLYLGLPKLMKAPQDKAMPYFAVVLIVAIVVAVVIGLVTSRITMMGGPLRVGGVGAAAGSMTLPGGRGSVDLGQLEAASKRMETASAQIQAGKATPATDPEVLKGYLPASLGAFSRTTVDASSGGAGGIEGSNAEGVYAKGDARIHLEVTDMGAAGAMAGMANAFNIKSSKETSTGYEKVGKVDGRMTTESYDRSSRHGEYSVLVGDRFMVAATGDNVSIDDLKSAVQAIGPSRLESLINS